MLTRNQLHKYQEYCVEQISRNRRCGLFLEMGLGKTISTLTAIEELMYQRFEVSRVLVVAPKRVAMYTWGSEVERWEHTQKLRVVRVMGSKEQRIRALEEEGDVFVTNIDNLVWLVKHLGESWPFDMVVIDESSMFKNANTVRFKTLRRFEPFFRGRLVLLTGTPSPNSLLDLWPQIYLLDRGERLGRYVTHYRNRYFVAGAGSGHIVYSYRAKEGSFEEITKRIGDVCVSMRSEDWLELPSLVVRDEVVGLSSDERSKYRAFKRDMVLQYGGEGDEVITASNAAVLSGKLRQWCGGAVYDENGKVVRVNKAKEERLLEMLEEINSPVLICYEFKHELERLKSLIPEARTIDEKGVVDAWNRGEVDVLLGQPRAMGHGLNLQKGGHILIWYTLTWSLELYEQTNARLWRQGQEESVLVYRLCISGSIDERVCKVLGVKGDGQSALMEAVKAELEE